MMSGANLHEMSNLFLGKNKKNAISLSPAEFAYRLENVPKLTKVKSLRKHAYSNILKILQPKRTIFT